MRPKLRVSLIGMGLRVGGAKDTQSLWSVVRDAVDTIASIPESRFDASALTGVPDRGGFIAELERFDHEHFGLSHHEAAALDPAARKLLEVVWDACEDAGVKPSALRSMRVGSYVGAMAGHVGGGADLNAVVGHSHSGLAARIAFNLGLKGPSFVIDSDRSSSLVALDAACRDIADGRVDAAIVCGANIIVDGAISAAFAQAGLLSAEGRCRFGDAGASGFVRSEGIAAVLLMPEAAAREQGRRSYATIVATAVNHDGGRSADYLTPSVDSQLELVRSALDSAGLTPNDLGYIEAHGTGTPVGDRTELSALASLFAHNAHPVLVGSLKSNIGHTEGCAGLLGVIKTALALQHGVIPQTLHVERPNPNIDWTSTQLELARTSSPWPQNAPRRAGVSAFGLTGTGAHCILEAAAPLTPVTAAPLTHFVLSAAHDTGLSDLARVYAEQAALPQDLSAALMRERDLLRVRLVGAASSVEEAQREWKKIAAAEASDVMQRHTVLGAPAKIVFVCPGQGAQWAGMGAALMRESPVFRREIEAIDQELERQFGFSVAKLWHDERELSAIDKVQPALFAMSVALAAVWRARGVVAHHVIGTSMGEVAAAVISGVLPLRDGVRIIGYRSQLMTELRGRGAMLSVLGPRARVEAALTQGLSIAVYNGPAATVVSGDAAAIDALAASLERDGLRTRRVVVDVASHSAQVDGILDELEAGLASLGAPKTNACFVSTVSDAPAALDARYWRNNLREPVRLAQTTDALLQRGCNVFIELSPHALLTSAIADCVSEAQADAVVAWSMQRERDPMQTLAAAESLLLAAGALPLATPSPSTHSPLPTRTWLGPAFPLGGAALSRSAPAAVEPTEDTFAAKLARSTNAEQQALISAQCISFIREVARLPSDKHIPTDRGFRELGLSSMMMVEVRNRLARAMQRALPATYFFEKPTIEKVAADLAGGSQSALAPSPLGALLVEAGLVTSAQITTALAEQARTNERIGETLVRLGFVAPGAIQGALALQMQEPVAIVGMALSFPGSVASLDAYWNLLKNGEHAIGPIPANRWRAEDAQNIPLFGGFLDDVERFDHKFFGISAVEAERMDPQQRLLLQVVWHALEHAGTNAQSLSGSAAGVFVGVSNYNEYARLKESTAGSVTAFDGVGDATSIIAGRIAYQLGLEGPALSVDTACSSSLVALHLAAQSLRNQECNMAIVAGVNLMLSPHISEAFAHAGMLASDGRCKTFDAAADGYVRSEGCAALVIKTVSEAKRAGDHIYAVINATSVNQDGRSAGLTAPNGAAQEALLRNALQRASLSAADVAYVEAHGTGTRLGDPIEVNALAKVFGAARDADHALLIGSVKSNIGHLEAAAGMAGIIKVALAFEHGVIPASLNVSELNPAVDWRRSGVSVVTQTTAWPSDRRRVAGVSAFGFSGTNAHVIVEAPPGTTKPTRDVRPAHPLFLSAADALALTRSANAWADLLATREDVELCDVAHTLGVARAKLAHRAGAVVSSRTEAIEALRAMAKTGGTPVKTATQPSVHFLASTSVYPAQGKALYESSKTFHAAFDVYAHALAGVSFDAPFVSEQRIALGFASSLALFDVLVASGFTPATIAGDGAGKIAAAVARREISLTDAARALAALSKLDDALPVHLRQLVMAARAEEETVGKTLAPNAIALGSAPTGRSAIAQGNEWRALCDCIVYLLTCDALTSTQGFDTDFSLRRVPGVAYPFARTKAWLAATTVQIETQIDQQTPAWLQDHRVQGEVVMPAAGLIDLVLQVGRSAYGDVDLSVSHLEIERAIVVRGPLTVRTTLQQDGSVLVTTTDGNGEQRSHAKARLSVSQDRPVNARAQHIATDGPNKAAEDSYATLAKLSLAYGPAFRLLTNDSQIAGGRVYELRKSDAHYEVLSAPLVDAAFQAAVLQTSTTTLHLPTGCERIEVVAGASTPAFAEVRARNQGAFDIALFDRNNVLVANISGLRLVPAADNAIAKQGSAHSVSNWLYETQWASVPQANDARDATSWEILHEPSQTAAATALRTAIVSRGHHAELRDRTKPYSLAPNAALLWLAARQDHSTGTLAERTTARLKASLEPLLALAQRLGDSSSAQRLVIVTEGAQAAHREVQRPWLTAVWGFARVLATEQNTLSLKLIDVDDVAVVSQRLAREIADTSEDEVAIYEDKRLVPRVVRHDSKRLVVPSSESFALRMRSKGNFDALALVDIERQRALDPMQVEVRVATVGLNFRDVLNALGEYPGDAGELGGDFCGVVTRVGSQVRGLAPGARVFGFGTGALASHVIVDARLLTATPPELSDTQAATMISTFLTAIDALVQRAELAANERVLIHAAAGGVGLAAVQVAKRLGARIYATASRSKHAYLRSLGIEHVYDSRSDSFHDAILADTGGQGVDVVLNSLTGEKLKKSLALLRQGGRFIEVGKAEVLADAARPTDKLYQTVAVDQRAIEEPDWFPLAYANLLSGWREHAYAPLPQEVHALADVRHAFRRMAQGHHVGKLVIQVDAKREHGACLITGGLGALGLVVAEALAKQGTKDIVLMARRAPGAAEQAAIARMRAHGALVEAVQVDVTNEPAVAELVQRVRARAGRIELILHAAGALADSSISAQQWDSFAAVLAPKTIGAEVLRSLVPEAHMQAFGSIATLVGNGGQSAYGAANAYLDGMAQHEPGSMQSVGWWAWRDAGMAKDSKRFDHPLSTEEGLAVFEQVRSSEGALLHVAPVSWNAAAEKLPGVRRTAKLQHWLAAPTTTTADFITSLAKQSIDARNDLMLTRVRSELSQVLGRRVDEADGAPLMDLGVDSLTSIELRNRLATLIAKPLPTSFVYDFPTVAALSGELLKRAALTSAPGPTIPRTARTEASSAIAVVGLACRFPGGSNDERAYWKLLREQKSGVVEVPADRWNIDAFYDPDPDAPGKMATRFGGFLRDADVAAFDNTLFGITPREAQTMDPQQRLLLECVWEALEDAGLAPARLAGTRTGVFVGISTSDYNQLMSREGLHTIDPYRSSGTMFSVAAGRVSYVLGLEGPAKAIDTACSSSLYALHDAMLALKNDECDMAIVGGVNLLLAPDLTIGFSHGRFMSPDGQCKTFDDGANGYVRGEGLGVLILQRQADSEREGLRIRAVVRSAAVNQDGRSGGLTVPSGPAQERVIAAALAQAHLTPGDVDYVEAHGTGTALGDPIEVNALARAYGPDRSHQRPLLIGSVKTNIGHLEAAAGMASLIKVILALEHEELPAQRSLRELSTKIAWQDAPISVVTDATPWRRSAARPRRAGLSGFAFQGSNAHVILEEAPLQTHAAQAAQHEQVLLLSARSEQALLALRERYVAFLQTSDAAFADVAHTAAFGRNHWPYRLAVVANDCLGAARALGDATISHTATAHKTIVLSGDVDTTLAARSPSFASKLAATTHPQETAATQAWIAWAECLHELGLRPRDIGGKGASAARAATLLAAAWQIPLVGSPADALTLGGNAADAATLYCAGGMDGASLGALLVPSARKVALPLSHFQREHFWFNDSRKRTASEVSPAQAWDALEQTPAAVFDESAKQEALRVEAAAAQYALRALHALGGERCSVDALIASHGVSPGYRSLMHKWVRLLAAKGLADVEPSGAYVLRAVESARPTQVSDAYAAELTLVERCGPKLAAVLTAKEDPRQLLFPEGSMELLTRLYSKSYSARFFNDVLAQLVGSLARLLPSAKKIRVLEVGGGTGSTAATLLPTLPMDRADYVFTDVSSWFMKSARERFASYSFIDYRTLDLDAPLEAQGYAGDTYDVVIAVNVLHATKHLSQTLSRVASLVRSGGVLLATEITTPGLFFDVTFGLVLQEITREGERESGVAFLDRQQWQRALSSAGFSAFAARPNDDVGQHVLVAQRHSGGASLFCDDAAAPQSQRLSAQAQARFAGHVVHGHALVPAAAMLRLMHAGVQDRALRSISFDQALYTGSTPLELRVDSTPEADGALVRLSSKQDGAWQQHASATAVRAELPAAQRDPSALWAELDEQDVDAAYADFAKRGLVYSGPYRALRKLASRGVRATALIASEDADALLDACLQTLIAIAGSSGSDALMPTGAEAFVGHIEAGEAIVCVQLRSRSEQHVVADFEIYGTSGRLVARLQGVSAQRVARERLSRSTPASQWLYEEQWEPSEAAINAPAKPWLELTTVAALASVAPAPVLWRVDAAADPTSLAALQQRLDALVEEALALSRWAITHAQPLTIVTTSGRLTHAPLWGLFRTLDNEHPALGVRLIEVDGANERALQDELDGDEPEVRLTTEGRFVRRLVRRPAEATSAAPPQLHANASYLVVGGKRGIGALSAERLVELGARHVALLGRSAPDAVGEACIARMRAHGATVLSIDADVGVEADVDRALALVASAMPPLKGVIQSAGVLADALIERQNVQGFRQVFGPKVYGSWLLATKLRGASLDFFLSYSSIAALLGPRGQATHAAACAFEDALTRTLRNQGLPALSIQWGAWTDVGAAAALRAAERFHDQGIDPITPAAGLETLTLLLGGVGQGEATCFASPMRWRVFSAVSGIRLRTVFSTLVPRVAPEHAGVSDTLAALAPSRRVHVLRDLITERVRQVMGGTSSTNVPFDRPLMDLGLDSLMAVELRSALSQLVGRPLSSTLMFDYPSVEKIAEHLLEVLSLAGPSHRVRAQVDTASNSKEPVAIVGLSCRFPGAPDTAAFWSLLEGGHNAVSLVPKQRWDNDAYFERPPGDPNKITTRYGGFLDDIDRFDAAFFEISDHEARHMDPQQRLLLEQVQLALEDACIDPRTLRGSKTGVFVGITSVDYTRLFKDHYELAALNAIAFASGRISYTFGFQGPSVSIDTVCSSSLVAISQATQALNAGTCDLAIVCGVNLMLTPDALVMLSQMHTQAPDGQCKTFDQRADGFVRAEGCGVVVLQRLSAAQREQSRVRALVRGTAVNQDGRSSGITAPNGPAQQDVISQALADAEVAPLEVAVVEAHGTGTALGDPIELRALGAVYGKDRPPSRPLLVGSVKTNIGHAESAAGMAGLVKAVLMLEHETIAPHRNVERLTEQIDWSALSLAVPRAQEPWPRSSQRRCVGLSSFGMSGTNAHVILEEAPAVVAQTESHETQVLFLSAKSEPALHALAERYVSFLKHTNASWQNIATSAARGRSHHDYRLSVIARSSREASEKLAQFLAGSAPEALSVGRATSTSGEQAGPSLAELASGYIQGCDPAAHAHFANARWQRVALPSYPFQRQRHWLDDAPHKPLYRLRWRAEANSSGHGDAISRWVFASSRPGEARNLVEALTRAGSRATLMTNESALLTAIASTDASTPVEIVYLVASDAADPTEALAARIKPLLSAIQTMAKHRRKLDWSIITQGAQAVMGPVLAPLSASTWGIGRVLRAEYPTQRVRLIDVDDFNLAATELLSGSNEPELGFRAGVRYVPRLSPVSDETAGELAARSVIVTGGHTGLGLLVAEWLVERGTKDVVLVSRRAPSSEADARIATMRARGANVVSERADVSVREELGRVATTARQRMGDIDLVVHAAGLTKDALLAQQTWEGFERVMAPKVLGALNVAALGAKRVICFSSLSALMGNEGQANYAAANAIMDALAETEQSRVLSLGFGAWAETGMAVGLAFHERGVEALTNRDGLALLAAAQSARGYVAALPLRRGALLPSSGPLSELMRSPVMAETSTSARERARLRALEVPARQHAIIELLRHHVAALTGADVQQLSNESSFTELGVDSLMGVELRNRVAALIGAPQPAGLVLDNPSISALANYTSQALESDQEQAPRAVRPKGEAPQPIPLSGIQREMLAISKVAEREHTVRVAWTIAGGRIDLAKLQDVARTLEELHPILRGKAVFDVLEIGSEALVPVTFVDARDWSETQLHGVFERDPPAHFTERPMYEIRLYDRVDGQILFFKISHLLGDVYSYRVLFDDLRHLLRGEAPNRQRNEPDDYRAYVEEERRYLSSSSGKDAAAYFERRLEPFLARMKSTDAPRVTADGRMSPTFDRMLSDEAHAGFQRLAHRQLRASEVGSALSAAVGARIVGDDALVAGVAKSMRVHYEPGDAFGPMLNWVPHVLPRERELMRFIANYSLESAAANLASRLPHANIVKQLGLGYVNGRRGTFQILANHFAVPDTNADAGTDGLVMTPMPLPDDGPAYDVRSYSLVATSNTSTRIHVGLNPAFFTDADARDRVDDAMAWLEHALRKV